MIIDRLHRLAANKGGRVLRHNDRIAAIERQGGLDVQAFVFYGRVTCQWPKSEWRGPFRCLVTERKQQQANGYSPETLGNRSPTLNLHG